MDRQTREGVEYVEMDRKLLFVVEIDSWNRRGDDRYQLRQGTKRRGPEGRVDLDRGN